MPQADTDVVVVGAGVIGLTTAICIAEAGIAVLVVSAEQPRQTTSAAAGALWGPHLVGMDERIARWAAITLDRLEELRAPRIGASALEGVVRRVEGVAASAKPGSEPPEYAAGGSLTPCPQDEIPAGYATAWRLSAPLIAMPAYLDYLSERLQRAGGMVVVGPRLRILRDACNAAPGARIIVNCAGYGARDLVPDTKVSAVRGQAVVVRNPGITQFFVGSGAAHWPLTYLFPHDDVVLLGGTEDEGSASREPDPGTAEHIVAACAAIRPELREAAVLEHRVGLRPVRPSVRLEAETGDDITIVHSYGHGGAGVTLSWGCAEDAAKLVLDALG